MTIDEQLREMARQADQRPAITAEEIVQRASRQPAGSLTTRFRLIDRRHVVNHRPVEVSDEEATMLDVETPTPSPSDERRNGPKRVMLGVLAVAAAVIAIAVVAIRKDEPVNSVDQPSSTVTVPSTAPHPLVGAWLTSHVGPVVWPAPRGIYVASFQSDGVFQMAGSDVGGIGVWEATGPNSGVVTWVVPFVPFADDQGDGLAKFRATFEVSSDGQSVTIDWEGELLSEPPQELGPGSQTGTRINVEPMGTPFGPIVGGELSDGGGLPPSTGTEAPAITG
jgi:hypothetical protein